MAKKGKKPIPKTQREISKSQQEPYVNPETGETRGNPNGDGKLNRGEQLSFKDDNTKPFSLGFKEIDEAIFYYIENVIKPTITQNGKPQKVPLLYGSAERWKQIQKDGVLRDNNGKALLPIMVFKRTGIEKVRSIANKLDANNPNNTQIFTKTYSKKNAYDNFDLLNNRIPVKQQYAVVVPDYVNITYDFVISTYYVEQMNKLIEAINYASDSYWGSPESFKFKASIDSYATPVQVTDGSERSVKCTFTLKLNGYVIPDTIQKDLTELKKSNTKAKTLITLETVSDINQPSTPSRFQIAGPRDFTTFNYPNYPSVINLGSGTSGIFMVTGSVSGNILTFDKSDGSTFNLTVDTGSAITVDTGSLMKTGSVNLNTLTFVKGDGTEFTLTVNTGSFTPTDTGSFMLTGSANSNELTFIKGDGTPFTLTVDTGSDINTGSFMKTGSVNLNTLTFTKGDGTPFTLTVDTGSDINTGSFMKTGSVNLNTLTFTKGDGTPFTLVVDTGSVIPTDTGSFMITGSVVNNELTFIKGDGTPFTLTVDTGSDIDTGSFMITGSVVNNELTFIKGDGTPFTLTVDTGSVITVDTGSLMKTGSVSLNTLTFTKGDNTSFSLTVDTGSAPIITLTGDITGSGTGSFITTLTPGAISSKTNLPTLTGGEQLLLNNGGALARTNLGNIIPLADVVFIRRDLTNAVVGSVPTGYVITATTAGSASWQAPSGGSTDTGSLLKTGSVVNNVLTFTKGDDSTFNLTVDTGSFTPTDTGSLLKTGSVVNNVLTFTKGDNTSFSLTVNTGSHYIETITQTTHSLVLYNGIGAVSYLEDGTNDVVQTNSLTASLAPDFWVIALPSANEYTRIRDGEFVISGIDTFMASSRNIYLQDDGSITGSSGTSTIPIGTLLGGGDRVYFYNPIKYIY